MGGRIGIEKLPDAFSFEERNSPTIGVMIRESSSGLKTRERETDVCWYITIHSKELAHATRIIYNRAI